MLPTLATRSATRASADARLDELLDVFVQAYEEYVREHDLPVNLCIQASRITSKVLEDFGISGAVSIGVDVVATPPRAETLLASGTAPWDLPRSVDAVGVLGSDAVIGDGWSGHVLAFVQAVQGRRRARLVDPTAMQFSAPSLGVNVAGHFVDATDAFLKGRPLVASTEGAALWLRRNARLDGFRGELADQPFVDEVAADLAAVLADAIGPVRRRAA